MATNYYNKPNLTVDAVILADNGDQMKLLVVERKNAPFKGKLALPGGFVNQFEIPYSALIRELAEETSLNFLSKKFLSKSKNEKNLFVSRGVELTARGGLGRDPRGWTVTIPYLFYLSKIQKVKAADDARRAFWIKLSDLPELAFDHGSILCEALAYFWDLIEGKEGISLFSKGTGFASPKHSEFARKKELIFFGGTFSPWHEGHNTVLMSIPKSIRNRVVVVPDRNPLKGNMNTAMDKKKSENDYFCAFKYYRNILSKVTESGAYVYPGFCGQENVNPTSSWLPYVKKSCSLLMGDDSFIGLKKWRDPEKFLLMTKKIFVVPRWDNYQAIKKSLEWVKSVNKKIIVEFMDHHPYQNVSSTKIRSDLVK